MFIDETGASTKMPRRDGRARGLRLRLRCACHATSKSTAFVGALRRMSLTKLMVLDGPLTAALFLAYARQALAQTLVRRDVVICTT